MTDQKPTCSTCRWFKQWPKNDDMGDCKAGGVHVKYTYGHACPAHDSGAFDEAVKQLISKIKDQPDGWNCEAEYKAVEKMLKEARKYGNELPKM